MPGAPEFTVVDLTCGTDAVGFFFLHTSTLFIFLPKIRIFFMIVIHLGASCIFTHPMLAVGGQLSPVQPLAFKSIHAESGCGNTVSYLILF